MERAAWPQRFFASWEWCEVRGAAMAQCQVCRTSGGNMKQCTTCRQVWCANCARAGKGHYPKSRAANVCPYCGKYTVVPAK
jgi:hypothetical protein